MYFLELDTPVYVNSHQQYGVVRKSIKNQESNQIQQKGNVIKEEAGQYEVRLSSTLENILVEPTDLKRIITIQVRIHSYKGLQESQTIAIKIRCDNSVLQLLTYIAQIAQVAPNFINIYHKAKKLGNSDFLYKENVVDGDKLLCIQG